MADENQDIQAPKVPKDKEGVFAVVKAYVDGADISDPTKRTIINELSHMIQSSNAPIAQIMAEAKVMVDNLVAVARGEAETKERSVSKGLKLQTEFELFHGLSEEQCLQVTAMDARLKQLAEDRLLLSQTTTALTSKVNTILKNILPGVPPLENGPEAFNQYWDGLTEDEKKKKAKELEPHLPDIQELGKAAQQELNIRYEERDILVKQNKILHRLQGDTLDAQIPEIEDRQKRGKSNTMLDERHKQMVEVKEAIKTKENIVQTTSKVTDVVQEHTREQSEKIEKESEKIQKESEKIELKLEAKQEEKLIEQKKLSTQEETDKQLYTIAAKRMGLTLPQNISFETLRETIHNAWTDPKYEKDKTVTAIKNTILDKTVQSVSESLQKSGMKVSSSPSGSSWTEKTSPSVEKGKDNKDLPRPPDPNGKIGNGWSR